LVRLKRYGLVIPEFMKVDEDQDLLERKIGGLKPWAWGPVASSKMRKYISAIPDLVDLSWKDWKKEDSYIFSKKAGLDLARMFSEEVGEWCDRKERVVELVSELAQTGDVLLKAPWSSAGRGHLRLVDGIWTESSKAWLDKVISQQGGVVVEPWLEKVLDFSAQYEVTKNGVKLVGMTRVVNDEAGRYLGTMVHHKWTIGLDAQLTEFLFRNEQVMRLYKIEIPKYIKRMLDADFTGNFGVDSMVYLNDGNYRLRKVVELNPRVTMGRVATELYQKFGSRGAGFYQILRKSKLGDIESWVKRMEGVSECADNEDLRALSLPINDPFQATEFIAVWHIRKSTDEMLLNEMFSPCSK